MAPVSVVERLRRATGDLLRAPSGCTLVFRHPLGRELRSTQLK